MSGEIGVDADDVAASLRPHLGDDVDVEAVERIRPWTVARCSLRGADAPATVIVKWLRSNPEGFRVDPRQMDTEAAALALLGATAPGLAPELIAHDPVRHLLVSEDLAPRRPLHSVLAAGLTPAGLAGLHSFAAAMARLHASTATVDVAGPWMQVDPQLLSGDEATHRVVNRLDELAPTSTAVRADLGAALAEIDDPGDLAAFSNGDSGANNCLVRPDGSDARLIDFEHARRRHVLLDASALFVPGPVWMTVADPAPLGVESTYRTTLGEAVPGVLDDGRYGAGLAAACALVALSRLARVDTLDRREPGHHSRAQLVVTVERAVHTMQRWSELESLAGWLQEVAGALRRRWVDADLIFPDDYTQRESFDPGH